MSASAASGSCALEPYQHRSRRSSRTFTTGFSQVRVRAASWPLKKNTHAPKAPEPKIKTPQKQGNSKPKPKIDVEHLLQKRSNTRELPIGALQDIHSKCETWLPPAPKVERPQSIYNAATLAYLGDCIYELYVRRHFFFPPLNINEYNHRVMALVCCEAQDALLKELLKDDFLSDKERDIIRWGRNIEAGKTRTIRRAGAAVYSRASSLETLVGYLYLTNVNRLDATMRKLGFSADDIV